MLAVMSMLFLGALVVVVVVIGVAAAVGYVADWGGLTKAADRLHLTQSALSRTLPASPRSPTRIDAVIGWGNKRTAAPALPQRDAPQTPERPSVNAVTTVARSPKLNQHRSWPEFLR